MAGIGQGMLIKGEECGTESSGLEHSINELPGQSMEQPERLVDETRWLEVFCKVAEA